MFCAKCGKELPGGATFCPSCGAPVQAAAPGAATAAPTSGIDTLTRDQRAQEYWIERLIAYVIDAAIVYFALFVVVAIISIPFLVASAFNIFSVGGVFAFFFGGFAPIPGLIFVFYFAFMESTSGASFGKRIFHLKVVSRTGSNPTFGQAFIRNISKIYWLLLILDVIIGLALSKGYTQKYSDQYIGTSVTRS